MPEQHVIEIAVAVFGLGIIAGLLLYKSTQALFSWLVNKIYQRQNIIIHKR